MIAASSASPPPAARKPLGKRLIMLVRRGHLYFGLFLLPWAVLYGVTAFLFNHPTAFADSTATPFGPDALRGTPMEVVPTPADTAAAVVAALNQRAGSGAAYTLLPDPPPAYAREFASVPVKADDGTQLTLFFDLTRPAGSIRGQPPRADAPAQTAPFAVGTASTPGRGGRGGGAGRDRPAGKSGDGLKLPDTLADRMRAAAPAVLLANGFPAAGEVGTVNVPDLRFRLSDVAGEVWAAAYNAGTGGVTGRPADVADREPLTARRFLLRLHTAHGYPSGGGVRWWWAVLVDAMAFVMVFWGVSGLLMWWQLKATRRAGLVTLALSVAAATALGVGMYQALGG